MVVDKTIWMVRGDDEALGADMFTGENGELPFEMGEGDTLTLTVRELPDEDSEVIFSSTSVPGGTRIIINHADTADADPGEYSADIELLTADNKHKTVWPTYDKNDMPNSKQLGKNYGNFIILPEVTRK